MDSDISRQVKITVFTPTYNRAYIIEGLYRSLQRQSFTDFEWLVVDDGSTDGTEELFQCWKKEDDYFPIRYYKKANGGKCRAINQGLDLANGELFFTVDSDDYLTDDALEKVQGWFDDIHDEKIVGIVANRGFSAEETRNYLFDEEYLDKSLLDIYSFERDGKQVFDGERAFIFYTDFHRRYKYPEFDGENFMTEAVAWNRMAHDGYKMRFYNDIIWVFKYREDGLTKAGNAVFLDNPYGYGLWLREKSQFEGAGFIRRMKLYYTFACELTGKYTTTTISKCIGASKETIRICLMIHRMLQKIRGINDI